MWPRHAQDCRQLCEELRGYSFSENSAEWKLKKIKTNQLPFIVSSQFITANPFVQSHFRVYSSARNKEKLTEACCVFPYKEILSEESV